MRLPVSCLAIVALVSPVLAQGSGPLALSQILSNVEANGARTVYSAEQDRRGWEVVSCAGRSRDCVEEVIDATSGEVRFREREMVSLLPPQGALPASQIASQIEAMNIGQIREMEFDDRRWEVDVRNGARRAEFRIDPMTGGVRRCEGTLC